MPFAFHYAARSDVGMVRTHNEDSGYAGPHLLAMADGMGGHAGGDIASSTVIAALVDLDDEALGGREASQSLLDRISTANAELGAQIHDEPGLDGMGTTLIPHVFESLAAHARMNLHARVLYGRDDHHKAEGLFKALGRALDTATQLDPRRSGVPSTKGMI